MYSLHINDHDRSSKSRRVTPSVSWKEPCIWRKTSTSTHWGLWICWLLMPPPTERRRPRLQGFTSVPTSYTVKLVDCTDDIADSEQISSKNVKNVLFVCLFQVHYDVGSIFFHQGCTDRAAYQKARDHFRQTKALLKKVFLADVSYMSLYFPTSGEVQSLCNIF